MNKLKLSHPVILMHIFLSAFCRFFVGFHIPIFIFGSEMNPSFYGKVHPVYGLNPMAEHFSHTLLDKQKCYRLSLASLSGSFQTIRHLQHDVFTRSFILLDRRIF